MLAAGCVPAFDPGSLIERSAQLPGFVATAMRVSDSPGPFGIASDALIAAQRLPIALTILLVVGAGLAAGIAASVRRPDLLLSMAPGLGALALAVIWWVGSIVVGSTLPVLASAVLAAIGWILASARVVGALRGWMNARPIPAHPDCDPIRAGRLARARLVAAAETLAPPLIVWLAALAMRAASVAHLAAPPWVDAVHHAYLANLLLVEGVPADFGPALPFGPFTYHFGFHAVVATVATVSGAAIPDALLAVGQFFIASAALAAYAVGWSASGRRSAGIVAACVAGLVSIMPAYYLSWSRYPHVAGLIALAAIVTVARPRQRLRSWSLLAAAGAFVAGLPLVHPRVAVLGVLLALAWLVVALARRRRVPWGRVGVPIAIASIMVGPWIWRVWTGLVGRIGRGGDDIAAVNVADLNLLSTGHDPVIYAVAAAATFALLATGRPAAWIVALWLALAAMTANPQLLRQPGGMLVGNAALLISLWLPAAAMIGVGAAETVRLTRRFVATPARRPARYGLAIGAIAFGLVASGPSSATLNPATVLVSIDDRRVLDLARASIRSGELVMTRPRLWQLETYVGADAGYWIGAMTPGTNVVPPALYGLGPVDWSRSVSSDLASIAALLDQPDAVEAFVADTRARHATWLFVGERAPVFDVMTLDHRQDLEVAGRSGGARLYRVLP